MSTRAVIFDIDDTLISELQYARSGYRKTAEYIARELLPERNADTIYDELIALFDADHKNVFNRFLLNNGCDDNKKSVMELVNVYREHFPDIAYFDDVLPTVRALKEKGIHTGILSDGYAITQRQKVRALKAEDIFDIIVLTDELGRDAWKPSPEGFRLIEEKLGISPNEILYVGDNPGKDFYLSESAGIKTARIKRENGVYLDTEYYMGVKEDYSIGSLNDIMGLDIF